MKDVTPVAWLSSPPSCGGGKSIPGVGTEVAKRQFPVAWIADPRGAIRDELLRSRRSLQHGGDRRGRGQRSAGEEKGREGARSAERSLHGGSPEKGTLRIYRASSGSPRTRPRPARTAQKAGRSPVRKSSSSSSRFVSPRNVFQRGV